MHKNFFLKAVPRIFVFLAVFTLLCLMPSSCAQRGRPDGGPQDTIPPVVISARPANYTTHFNGKIIRINFDEYIKLEKPDQQILISPPLKTKPIIKPMGQALKYVEIELTDTLKENTTYTINFGQSIQDNNEGNILPFYKYVFSTGDYIDSLRVSGRVKDAFDRETEEFVSILLYRLDTAYTDSIVFKRPPDYIAYTQDSTHTFSVENIKEGQYKIIALKDKNQDYVFNQKREKIGFLEDTISLPTTEEYALRIFREIPNYKLARPQQMSRQELLFGYEGLGDSIKIKLLSEKPDNFEAFYYKQRGKDSISYWFKPVLETDSLLFEVVNRQWRDTVKMAYLEMEADSLKLSAEPTSSLPMTGWFELSANSPLVKMDTALVRIINQDSLPVNFKTTYQRTGNKFIFDFDKQEKQTYHLQFLPGAVTDFFAIQNDTLDFKLSTKPQTDYADVRLQLQNINRFPVIVQLTDEKGKTKRELIHHEEDGALFDFHYVEPGKYYVRVIYDDNDNGVWDTGNYLQKIQPEEVIYMPELLDVRKNWEITQTFTLQ